MSMIGAPATSALTGMLAGVSARAEGSSTALRGGGEIEKAFICFRIGAPIWLNEARFGSLLDLFDRHPGVTDEITLFTSETHPPLPLDLVLERATLSRLRMEAARQRGYRSGINILSTLGHHEENLPNSLSGPYTPMTDPSGKLCRGSFCPSDEGFQAYIVQVYKALAGARPDYIWIDDDVRLWGHGPISACCFCDACVQRFSKRVGHAFTRDSLTTALSSGPVADKLRWRRALLQHNRDSISDLFRLIEKTVHAVTPGLPLGFMTGDRFYEGYDFDTWVGVLAGPQGAAVFWRPGGGTYRDERLADITDKAHDIGRQVAMLPDRVRCIESELESFPYQRLKKSAHATALEAAAYIASGCTGTAFNVLTMYDEPLDEYEPLVVRLGDTRPFLNLLARSLGRGPCVGIHSGWTKDSYAAQDPEDAWFHGPRAPVHCNEMWSTGLPPAYSADHAPVVAWSGDQVLALSDQEIREALTKGIYLDGPALIRLNALGYGALTGFEVVDSREVDCIEELTDHPLNGEFSGRRRNGRQAFWQCPTYLFRPTADNTETLSRCVDYTYRETAPCCGGVFENAEGGRVCVAGYYPWDQLQTLSKSTQLKSVLRWLSKDTLPAYVTSFHRINLWCRLQSTGTIAIALLNAYLDPAQRLELCVYTERELMQVTDMRGATTQVKASRADGPYQRFVLPNMPPWEMALAVL